MDVVEDTNKTQSNKRQYKNRLLKLQKHLESIHESKKIWNYKHALIKKIDQRIERRGVILNKALEKLSQRARKTMDSGHLDAPENAKVNNVFAIIAEFHSEARLLTNKLNAAKRYINQNGGFWRQKVPEVADLQKLTFNERKLAVKTWTDGGRFLRIWVKLFKNSKINWSILKEKVLKELEFCIQHQEKIFEDKKTTVTVD